MNVTHKLTDVKMTILWQHWKATIELFLLLPIYYWTLMIRWKVSQPVAILLILTSPLEINQIVFVLHSTFFSLALYNELQQGLFLLLHDKVKEKMLCSFLGPKQLALLVLLYDALLSSVHISSRNPEHLSITLIKRWLEVFHFRVL